MKKFQIPMTVKHVKMTKIIILIKIKRTTPMSWCTKVRPGRNKSTQIPTLPKFWLKSDNIIVYHKKYIYSKILSIAW